MEYLVDTERVGLDYSEDRILKEMPAYRLTLYDKYGHFDADVYLTDGQIDDLIAGLNKIKENFEKYGNNN